MSFLEIWTLADVIITCKFRPLVAWVLGIHAGWQLKNPCKWELDLRTFKNSSSDSMQLELILRLSFLSDLGKWSAETVSSYSLPVLNLSAILTYFKKFIIILSYFMHMSICQYGCVCTMPGTNGSQNRA